MALQVMCCSCNCSLGRKGGRVFADGRAGEFDFLFQGRIIRMPGPGRCAEFADRAAADKAVQKAGWTIRKVYGEDGRVRDDHRCPICSADQEKERTRVGHDPEVYRVPTAGALLSVDYESQRATQV